MKPEVGLRGEDTGGKECLSRRGALSVAVPWIRNPFAGIITFVRSFSKLRDQFARQAAKLSRKPDCGVDLMSESRGKNF